MTTLPFCNQIELSKTVFTENGLMKTGLPQVAFAGRSNVGKSSLLNYLFNKKIAKTSSAPGKTRSVNFYFVDKVLFFVDLPGYGYAKAPKEEQNKWKRVLEKYFEKNEALKEVFLLLDCRHLILENDKQMIEWLNFYGIPYSIILTKTDKLSQLKMNEQIQLIKKEELYSDRVQIFPASVLKRTGRQEILDYIQQKMKAW